MASSYDDLYERISWQLKASPAALVLLIGALVLYPARYSICLSLTRLSAGRPRPILVSWASQLRAAVYGRWLLEFAGRYLRFVLGSAVIGQFVLGARFRRSAAPAASLQKFDWLDLLLPNAVPEVVAGFIWISMLAGGEYSTLNRMLGGQSVQWLQPFPLAMIIVANTWRGIASAMILMMAGLSAVTGRYL